MTKYGFESVWPWDKQNDIWKASNLGEHTTYQEKLGEQ